MTSSDLGPKLTRLREALKLSQDEAAKGIGKSRNHLGQIERGEVIPRIDELEELLTFYGTTLRKFFGSAVPDHYSKPEHYELHRKLQDLLDATHTDLAFGITVNVNSLHSDLVRRKNASLPLLQKRVKRRRHSSATDDKQ